MTPTVDNSGKNVVFSSEDTEFSVGVTDIKDNGALLSTDNTAKILSTDNDSTLVEVTLDEEIIQNPDTVYPVSVTLTASSTPIGSFTPPDVDYTYFEDTTLYTTSATEAMDAPYLIVGQAGSNSLHGSAFMRYDTSMLEGIDPRLVYDATLVLVEASGNQSSMVVNMYRVTSDWLEDVVDLSLFYSHDFTYGGNNDVIMSDSGTDYSYELDVTQLFTDHMLYEQGYGGGVPNYGFQLYADPSYESGKHICSSEHPDIWLRPYISMTYEDPEPLILGYTTHDYINRADPVDWYSFTPAETSHYDFYTTGNTGVCAFLYDSDLALVTQDNTSSSSSNFRVAHELQANETYYLKVQGKLSTTSGYYYLNVLECLYNEFSTARTSPYENQTMIEAMAQSEIDYNNWPAGEKSQFYEQDSLERAEALTQIQSMARLATTGELILEDAGDALSHYLDNTGTNHTIDNENLFYSSEEANTTLKNYIDSFLEACEHIVPSNSFRNVYNNVYLELTCTDNLNWHYTLGNCTITIEASVYRTDSYYSADVTINVVDFYDWQYNNFNLLGGFLPIVPADLWELHHGGLAKTFTTIGTSNVQISWTAGQRCDTGITVVPN